MRNITTSNLNLYLNLNQDSFAIGVKGDPTGARLVLSGGATVKQKSVSVGVFYLGRRRARRGAIVRREMYAEAGTGRVHVWGGLSLRFQAGYFFCLRKLSTARLSDAMAATPLSMIQFRSFGSNPSSTRGAGFSDAVIGIFFAFEAHDELDQDRSQRQRISPFSQLRPLRLFP